MVHTLPRLAVGPAGGRTLGGIVLVGAVRRVDRARKSLFWLLSVAVTLSFGGLVAAPAYAAAANGPGTIEVCKAAKNGMAGLPFQFRLNGGAPFTVNGGACSGPMAAPAGNNTVVETQQPGLEVQKIKANKKVSENLSTGTVVVKVKAGSTPANETLVTYTNRRNPAIGLKVCKVTTDPTLEGDSFSFTENGGPAYSVKAGTPASPICGPVHKYALDTQVNIAELAVANTIVSNITVSDGRGSNVDTATRTVTATIGAGVTVVTYTNVVEQIPQFGYIEVCKESGDEYSTGGAGRGYVTGSFDFTITAPGFTATRSILVGQCSEPIQVPAGNVSVAEAARFPYFVSAIEVTPSNRLVTKNLSNGTVTVVVPSGDTNDETLVTYENSTRTGLVKICKTLAPNSGALAGVDFFFIVEDVNGAHTVRVTAGAAGSTTCVIEPRPLPLGTPVMITEEGQPSVVNTSVTVSPASQNLGSAPPTANLSVGTGITTATFVNQAWGTVEVCKIGTEKPTFTQTFQFSVNGGPAFDVRAGQCSQPIPVPAGTATVYELAKTSFHLVSVTAVGPAGENRIVSGFNPVTVSTPFGGVENETLVTFTNSVDTGQFKICKESSEPTLQDVYFEFKYAIDFLNVEGSANLKPGQCSALSVPVPVVLFDEGQILINVTETIPPGVDVSQIKVANGDVHGADLDNGVVVISVHQGITTVTFTNVREPLVPEH